MRALPLLAAAAVVGPAAAETTAAKRLLDKFDKAQKDRMKELLSNEKAVEAFNEQMQKLQQEPMQLSVRDAQQLVMRLRPLLRDGDAASLAAGARELAEHSLPPGAPGHKLVDLRRAAVAMALDIVPGVGKACSNFRGGLWEAVAAIGQTGQKYTHPPLMRFGHEVGELISGQVARSLGRIGELDDMAWAYGRRDDEQKRDGLYAAKQVLEHLGGEKFPLGKVYLDVMEKVQEEGQDYVLDELARLHPLVAAYQPGARQDLEPAGPERKLLKRANILSSFLADEDLQEVEKRIMARREAKRVAALESDEDEDDDEEGGQLDIEVEAEGCGPEYDDDLTGGDGDGGDATE